ncbi:MAG: methyltransferase, partial [Neisseriaceae bacterium]|nr:methyltransferase [Neisseriaceae bacterium]
ETALFRLPETPATVWDLGCGSGILAISLKLQRPDCTVWASDISDNALKIAHKNAERHQAQSNGHRATGTIVSGCLKKTA